MFVVRGILERGPAKESHWSILTELMRCNPPHYIAYIDSSRKMLCIMMLFVNSEYERAACSNSFTLEVYWVWNHHHLILCKMSNLQESAQPTEEISPNMVKLWYFGFAWYVTTTIHSQIIAETIWKWSCYVKRYRMQGTRNIFPDNVLHVYLCMLGRWLPDSQQWKMFGASWNAGGFFVKLLALIPSGHCRTTMGQKHRQNCCCNIRPCLAKISPQFRSGGLWAYPLHELVAKTNFVSEIYFCKYWKMLCPRNLRERKTFSRNDAWYSYFRKYLF